MRTFTALCANQLSIFGLASALNFGALAADQVLFDFRDPAATNGIGLADASLSTTRSGLGTGLRIATGHAQAWPGLTLTAPQGHWDLSPYGQVAVQLKNVGTNSASLHCRVDNPGADGTERCVTGSLTLQPGQAGVLTVPLKQATDAKLDGQLFGMRGYPVAYGGAGTIDPGNITQLLIFVSQPKADHLFEVTEIRATGSPTLITACVTDARPFFPFIDTFGQYRHKTWPGKTESLQDLAAKRRQEARELERSPGPKDWDGYGGWAKGPRLKKTGFFRTEKVGGKWWLVDPDGHLFFSHGIDCVRMLDTTPIEERESWFEDFPGKQPEFREFLSPSYALKGYYQGRNPQCFSFAGANLLRKYGTDWRHTYPGLIHRRLRSWGLNTIANWSEPSVYQLRRTPYTDTIGTDRARMIEGSEGYWGKFPDVFDPGFRAALRRGMETKKNKSAGDPWCIGYFSDNEMSWGDELSISLGALKSPSDQAAKKVFVADLKAKYLDVGALNQAWGSKYSAWGALLESREAPDKDKARPDLVAFYRKAAEEYFRGVKDVIKAVAPQQLYLGCRFAWVNPVAAAAAAQFCDVVSYNLYRRSVADFQFNGGADVPLIIGEFHFGALDRGLFHTGLVPVADQEARARAYREYVQDALRHPQFVGCHWFQYQDEPNTGRVYDEENYQIGFVDVADTPYREMIKASREVADGLYTKGP